jgi:hypothetical protein
MNLHSHKYSGLANAKTIHIAQEKTGNIKFSTRKPSSHQHQHSTGRHNATIRPGSGPRRSLGIASGQARRNYRPDLRKVSDGVLLRAPIYIPLLCFIRLARLRHPTPLLIDGCVCFFCFIISSFRYHTSNDVRTLRTSSGKHERRAWTRLRYRPLEHGQTINRACSLPHVAIGLSCGLSDKGVGTDSLGYT